MFYLTSKFHVNRINTFGFMEDGEGGGGLLKTPPGPGTPKKPRPNRVKFGSKVSNAVTTTSFYLFQHTNLTELFFERLSKIPHKIATEKPRGDSNSPL